MKVLELEDISFSYDGGIPLLKDISFSLEKNEFLSIVGSSGCGKSTIIKLIAGIEKADKGIIKGLSTGYMPQRDLLLPWRTVLENIMLPVELNKKNREEGKKKAVTYLKKLHLDEYQDKLPQELSGGMRQRVSFLRTLLTEADILLLDEPFSALDAITKEYLQKWLLDTLKEFDKSIIFITHDINEALFLSDRILVCKDKPLDSFAEFVVPKDKENNVEKIAEMKKEILHIIRGDN
ncbi:ABC transporter ATP-binding protein [Fusobacterium perfoetens]|uniref:ABC transporter ATP-binding protein n=1 Tax=Fusobacterium perfoetens TaxID=852 RepID=UPI001F44D310|nr:ABC transporter ATP-binding protein [Fusobacterium perfoetens]MCF2624712.1 ABC transporter ATP-binding protein [Fusobacterium perfoetens]